MDIHRCRFVPYQSSGVNSIAFSHPKPRNAKVSAFARLAIGRANGDIEIWNPAGGKWLQEMIIRGGRDRSIDGLVWVTEPDQDLGQGRTLYGKMRLFSIGYTSTITEWDLETGKPKHHASGQHGDIWCLAAQPTEGKGAEDLSNKLIAGTIDGELAMYSTEDGELRFEKILVRSPTKKAQMVSMTFQTRSVVVVGCSDGTVRAYDLRGRMLKRMTLGADLQGGSKDIIVWSVKCLPNGNIVSGDSTGQICIWDGKTYTQTQRLQGHKQDVLSLAVSADGTSIMSGGMDRRTMVYRQNAGGSRWSKVSGRRYHNHDVKTMAVFESGRVSVIISGGPDTSLVVLPLKEIGRENHRGLSSLPQNTPLTTAPGARFIVSWWDREIHIWRLVKSASDIFNSNEETDQLASNRKLIKTILIKGDSNVASATINDDGSLLLVSTATGIKAFKLEHQNPARAADIQITSLEVPEKLSRSGASRIQISPDGKWLCAIRNGSQVLACKLQEPRPGSPLIEHVQKLRRIHRQTPRYMLNGSLGTYDRTINHTAFTADSRMLATADLAGYIDTWILREGGGDDAASSDESDFSDDDERPGDESWIRNPNAKLIPKLPTSPVALSFSAHVPSADVSDASRTDDYLLLTISSSWNILAFHPLAGSLTPWSRKHPRDKLPPPILDLLDTAKGVLWQGLRVWIYGVSFLAMLDMGSDLPSLTEQEAQESVKRKRSGKASGAGGKMKQGTDLLAPHVIQHDEDERWRDVEASPSDAESDSDEEMAEAGELQTLRNGTQDRALPQRKKWWITYKYRPIFGMAALSPPSAEEDVVEAALVERPAWDNEVPDSYYRPEEWER